MYHGKCESNIYINLSGCIAIAAEFNIGNENSLVINSLYMAERNPRQIKLDKNIEIHCNRCHKDIQLKEIFSYCSFCNAGMSITLLKIHKKTTGIYCADCVKKNKLEDSDLSPVTDCFKYISI